MLMYKTEANRQCSAINTDCENYLRTQLAMLNVDFVHRMMQGRVEFVPPVLQYLTNNVWLAIPDWVCAYISVF